MAFVMQDKVRLYWRADGDEGKPPLFFSIRSAPITPCGMR